MRKTKSNQEKNKREALKMNLKNLKKKIQGITLIALVVTVIVLLILAGVAINLTVGDNGLFKRAQNAADTWQMAELNEQKKMDKAADIIDEALNKNDIEQVTDEHPGILEQDEADMNIYTINSIEDLVFFAYDVTSGNDYEGKTVRLGQSLDFNSIKSYVDPYTEEYEKYGYSGQLKKSLTSGEGFKAIGNSENYFSGTFDGCNNTIYSLYQNIESSKSIRAGLFFSNSGEIKNLAVADIEINAKGKELGLEGYSAVVGGIVALNYGNVTNCNTSGNINVDSDGWTTLGGIVGIQTKNARKIENCSNEIDFTATNQGEMGSADITCGGIVGQIERNISEGVTEIYECVNRGNIDIDTNKVAGYFGGILGNPLSTGKIKNCYNIANIKASGAEDGNTNQILRLGGIIANTNYYVDVENCYNSGKISTDSKYAFLGGISADIKGKQIKNVINVGEIVAKGSNGQFIKVGGVVGRIMGGTLEEAYNIGKVLVDTNCNVSPIGNFDTAQNGIGINCYYLKDTVGIGESGSLAPIIEGMKEITLEEMPTILEVVNSENTFKEDTNNINNGYPILNWE